MNEIENAIKYFKDKWRNSGFDKNSATKADYARMAIQAIQEKAEREKGCDYCNNHKPLLDVYSEYSIEVDDREISVWQGLKCEETFKISFCPMCGRKLVGE